MKAGGRDVVQNGTIVTHTGDKTIELSFEDLNYRISFEHTSLAGEPKLETEIRPDHLMMRFVNFDNPLGVAWQGQVGKLAGNKLLYLAISVRTIGDLPDKATRSISFTFSTEVA